MKNYLKLLVICIPLVVMAIFFHDRYLSPNSGVNSDVGDHSAHLNISEHLTSRNIFPSVNQENIGDHATFKFLPVYHGILGFHVLVFGLETIGIPRPGAYALINDISLLILTAVFLFFIIDSKKGAKTYDLLFASLLFFPVFFDYFARSVNAGFYSILLSQACIAAGVYLFSIKWQKVAWILFLYAFFSYPDSLIWFIPLFLLTYPKYIISAFILAPIWLTMALIPLTRGSLMGDKVASLVPWTAVLSFLLLFGWSTWKTDKKLTVTAGIFTLYSFTLLLFTMSYLNPSYYGIKLSSFSYLLLPYIFIASSVTSTKRGRLFAAITLYFLLASNNLWSVYSSNYFTKRSTFNNMDFQNTRIAQKEISLLECEQNKTYIIPRFNEISSANALSSYNSVLMNYDLYSLEIKSTGLRQILSFQKELETYGQFMRSIRQTEVTPWIQTIESRIAQLNPELDFCLAVSKEYSSNFAKSQYFEKLYAGEQFVYFKPKKP